MKNKFVVYLHSCGLSQKELTEIFACETSSEEFFTNLSDGSLSKYISSAKRREGIVSKYEKISTEYIDKQLQKYGVNIIVLGDDKYPESLINIPHTPYILYIRGKIPEGDMFGVVGSRKISEYGKKVIQNIVPEVSKVFPVVSGGAAGCDTYAHKASLEAGSPTVVVVGTGIDQTYPVSNEKLFSKVVDDGGAVISIFKIGEPGNPYNFPVRNEIVVGLSKGILIIEAKEKSGSMITAGLTLDLGKDLYSVPGDIFSDNYSGTNLLIKNGEAKCVTQPLDILEEYNISVKIQKHKLKLDFSDEYEKKVYDTLTEKAVDFDELSMLTNIDTQLLLTKTSILELKGVIKKTLSGKYELI